MSRLDRHPYLWLALGVLLIVATELRWGLDPLAWVAWVPFLRFARLKPGWKPGLALVSALLVAWTVAVLKITTAPLPLTAAPMFGVPIGLSQAVPLVFSTAVVRRLNGRLAWLLVPASMALGELALHQTPFSSWGATAYTQLDNLPLLQLASVTGMAGVGAVVILVNVVVEDALERGLTRARRAVIATAALVMGLLVAGSARLAWHEQAGGTPVTPVATIGTDAAFGDLPLPSNAELRVIDDAIAARARRAAAAGARVIVATEASTLALPADVPRSDRQWSTLAQELDVDLLIGRIVPVSVEPLQFENQAMLYRGDGTIADPYLKHHPVPGEPAVAGHGAPPVFDSEAGRLSMAVCFDADFPRLGLQHAQAGTDLLLLPSSDWRGIDPIHTRMARLRAIEGGHSVLRSTRFGLSAAIDPLGRIRSQRSAFDPGLDLMVTHLPSRGLWTVYSTVGDAFLWLCGLVCILVPMLAFRRRR